MTAQERLAEFDRINRQRSLTHAESLALERLLRTQGLLGVGRKVVDWSPKKDAAIRDLRAKGWGCRAIGDELGMNYQTVRRRIEQLGLPKFRRGYATVRVALERGL